MSAAGRTSDASGAQRHVHLVAGTQHRQILLGADVGDDRRIVGCGQQQPHHRTLERQILDRRRTVATSPVGRVHRHPDAFRAHHQRRVTARLDRGVTGAGLQRRSENVDFDEIAVGAARLPAGPQVGLPDEVGDEHRRGTVVDLGRRADLVDVAGVHDRDAVAHRQRFLLVVGHVDERDPDLALNALELELHRVAQFEVQRAERFVEKQRARIVDEGPGQCDTLLLAARQLGGPALGEVGQPDDLQQFVDPLADLGLVLLAAPRSVRDVVPHRHVREQRVVLEHGVDVALVRWHPRDVDPLEPDRAFGRSLETRDHPQRGRLPAAGRAEQREELARGDGEVRLGDRDVVREALRDVVDLDDRAALGAVGRVLSRRLVYGGGV